MFTSVLAEKKELKSVDLFVTERCNLNCSYCFHPKSDAVLDFIEGKRILNRLYEANPNEMLITFFGGEPLLFPNLIIELAEYARQLWKSVKGDNGEYQTVRFSVSTNGTFFDEKIFRKFSELGIGVQISMDGDRETTELNRKGIDYSNLVDNIKSILEILPNTSVRMTFTPDTVGRLSSNVLYCHQLGFNSIMHHAVMEANWSEDSIKQYEYQIQQIYHYRRFVKRRGSDLNIFFIDKPLHILNDEEMADVNFCEAGKSYLGILPNGDVYPCHRAASNRKFKLGNILDDTMPIIRGSFLTLNKASVGCQANCPAAKTCHTCVFTHFLVNGSLSIPIKEYCKICLIEHQFAESYLQTEINDRAERKLTSIGLVVMDIAEQLKELNKK